MLGLVNLCTWEPCLHAKARSIVPGERAIERLVSSVGRGVLGEVVLTV